MNDERLKALYAKLQNDQVYTKSYEEFVTDYSSEKAQSFLYNLLSGSKAVSQPEKDWIDYYFPKDAKIEPEATTRAPGKEIVPPWESEPAPWNLPKDIDPLFQMQKSAYDRLKERRGGDLETPAYILEYNRADQFTKDELAKSRTPMESGFAELLPEGQRATLKNYQFDLSALSKDMDEIVGASGFLKRQLDEKYGVDWADKNEARIAELNRLGAEIEKLRAGDINRQPLIDRYNTLSAQYKKAPSKQLESELNNLAAEINKPSESEAKVTPLIDQYNKMRDDLQKIQDDPAFAELGKMTRLYQSQYQEAKKLIEQDRYKAVADYLNTRESVQQYEDAQAKKIEGIQPSVPFFGQNKGADESYWSTLRRQTIESMAMRGAGKMLAGIGAGIEIAENAFFGDKKYTAIDSFSDYLRGFSKDTEAIFAAPSKFSRAMITNTAQWNRVDPVTKEKETLQVDFDDNGNMISLRDSGGYEVFAMLSPEEEKEISQLKKETQTNWYTVPYKSAEVIVDLGYLAIASKLAGAPISLAGRAAIGAAGRTAAVAGLEPWVTAAAKSYALTKNAQIASTLGTVIGVSAQMADPLYEQGLELFNGDKTKAAQFAGIVGPAIGLSSSILGIEAIVAGKNPLLQTVLSKRALSFVDDVYNPQVAAREYLKGIGVNAISETVEETIVESLITNGTAAFLGAKFESPFEDMKEFAETAVISAVAGTAFSSVSGISGSGDMKYASLLAGIEMGKKFDDSIEKAVKDGIIQVPEPLQQDFISKQRIRATIRPCRWRNRR